jgi:hypothetical protein
MDERENKSLQSTTYKRSSLLASRKQLFEAANYLLCQLALQIQDLERTNTNASNGEQREQQGKTEQTEQAEEKTPE